MITLQDLVRLRGDEQLVAQLDGYIFRAMELVGPDPQEWARQMLDGVPGALIEAKEVSRAMMLAVYVESRRPFIEFLNELDQAAIVRVRPHLHAKLKELIRCG